MITISTTTFVLTLLAIAAICVVVGRFHYKRSIAETLAQFHELGSKLRALEVEKNEAAAEITALTSQLNDLEHQKITLEADARSNEDLRKRLDDELEELTSKLSDSNSALRSSELSEKTVSAQLAERSEKIEELNSAISEAKQGLLSYQQELKSEQKRVSEIDKTAKEHEVRAGEFAEKLEEYKQSLAASIARYDLLQEKYNSLSTEYAEVKTSIKEREQNLQQQIEQFNEQKESLSAHFKELATDVLDVKSKALQQTSQQSISALMNPFKTSIEDFKKEVQAIHHRDGLQQGELKKELQNLKDLNHKLSTEAHELSTALRGQKKLQGNWGELVLENVLDRSGLQRDKDYRREVSINTEDGRLRPDVIVDLPQSKNLVIDSKVSLNAYTRYVNAEDESERSIALKEHVSAVGDRINELAGKEYGKLPGLNSPEMVFMFIPIESAFVEALKADESLFQRAIEQNVLVATPTTLLTSLNIVRQLWRFEDQNKHTALLASKAEAVFKKLNTFLVSFSNVKKGLDKANEAYVKAENQLMSGRGNLVKQVGDFKKLAPTIKDELPAYFSDKAELELDFEPSDALEGSKVDNPDDAALTVELHQDKEEEINVALSE